jgi:hypothetical protein
MGLFFVIQSEAKDLTESISEIPRTARNDKESANEPM